MENNLVIYSPTCTFMESQVVFSENCKCFAPINAMLSPLLPVSNEWKHPALLANQLLKRRFALFRQSTGKKMRRKKKSKRKSRYCWLWEHDGEWMRDEGHQHLQPGSRTSARSRDVSETFLCSGVRSHLFLLLSEETPFGLRVFDGDTIFPAVHIYVYTFTQTA